MPELPEVETIKRGIEPHIITKTIQRINLFNTQLRWPIPNEVSNFCQNQSVESISRRAKYILIHLQTKSLIIHLGMSGSLRIAIPGTPLQKHDHVEVVFNNQLRLLLNDPRRFGCFLVCNRETIMEHTLLRHLGPEPLTETLSGDYLYEQAKGRSTPVKTFIMNQATVVGVGNIYANEALFHAGIHPLRRAGKISKARYRLLAMHIKRVLEEAITLGGTTLKDFRNSDGKPGYFQQQLAVYGRGKKPCPSCNTCLKEIKIGQRTSVYCPACQH